MKQVLIAIAASILCSSVAYAQEEQAASCETGFLILPDRIYLGCQLTETTYQYFDFEGEGDIVEGELPVQEIVLQDDERYAQLQSLLSQGFVQGVLESVPTALEQGYRQGHARGYSEGIRRGRIEGAAHMRRSLQRPVEVQCEAET